MKKQNNRYRNGNNNVYTLNYKFDSVSIAGKISGTALDLIRRYNDLAKEAQSSGDYVDMEIYRQYAEHYRKIVTDINERRQNRQDNNRFEDNQSQQTEENQEEKVNNTEENVESNEPQEATVSSENGYVETLPATENVEKKEQVTKASKSTKTLHIVEIKEENEEVKEEKPKRVYRRKTTVSKKTAS